MLCFFFFDILIAGVVLLLLLFWWWVITMLLLFFVCCNLVCNHFPLDTFEIISDNEQIPIGMTVIRGNSVLMMEPQEAL